MWPPEQTSSSGVVQVTLACHRRTFGAGWRLKYVKHGLFFRPATNRVHVAFLFSSQRSNPSPPEETLFERTYSRLRGGRCARRHRRASLARDAHLQSTHVVQTYSIRVSSYIHDHRAFPKTLLQREKELCIVNYSIYLYNPPALFCP